MGVAIRTKKPLWTSTWPLCGVEAALLCPTHPGRPGRGGSALVQTLSSILHIEDNWDY